MKNPKLIEGLKMLEKEEWISFRKYILMYCTKSSDNYKLLDYLFSVRNGLGELSDIETIKKPLFEKMTVKSFSNLMSRVFIWFEEWLVWYKNKKDNTACDIQLVKIYNRNGVFNLADKTYRRVEKKLLAQQQLDLRTHKDLYQLHHNHYFSDNPVKYERKEEILETLISYYTLQVKEHTLLYIAEMHNWGRIQNYDFSKDIALLNQMTVLIPDTETSQVVQLINVLVVDLDAAAFIQLKEIILRGRLVPDSELYILSVFYMVASSMLLWNNNKISDPQLVFDALDFGLESGVLLNTGKMPLVRFINMITTLGHMKTSEKTYAFVDKWKHEVADEDEEAIRALGYAHLKFIEEKLDEIIPLLIGQRYETDSGRLRSSVLELIGLYSDRKNNYSLLVNRINNFKRVLRVYGSKRSNMAHRSFLNFTKVLELMVKRDFVKLSINLDNYKPIIYKRWLEKELKAGQK